MSDQSETPKILEELSKGSAKASSRTSRQQKKARRRFLLVLAFFVPVFGGVVYVGYQQYLLQQNISSITSENQQLGLTVANQNSLISQLQEQLQAPPEPVEIDDTAVREVESALNAEISQLQQQLLELQSQQTSAVVQPNLDWKLIEAEFLLRLANQKLQLEADVGSAILLLEDADTTLVESGNNAVFAARQSIANDLSLLRGTEIVDREGIFIRLSNLTNRIDQIDLLGSMRENFENRRSTQSTQVDIGAEPSGFIDSTYDFLSSIFVWREWEENPAAMLAPGQESTIKQSLRLMLEQAQYAMASKDTELYLRSLSSSKAWLQRYAVTETAVGLAMLEEINELSSIDISPSLPSLEGSLSSIEQLTPD
ncbi:MAG: hypothetical protein GKR91_15510 [Pseudomonadales bacterium]|nr:hypothetical protein [Pseudomonadales bacterium]